MYDFEADMADSICDFMLKRVKEEGGNPIQMVKIASFILFNMIDTYCLTKKDGLAALKSCHDALAKGLSATKA